jgi:putative spermidine/putrescine transport system permease protein
VLVVVYLGSLAVLLVAAFWTLDDFSGLIVRGFSLDNFRTIIDEPVYRRSSCGRCRSRPW